MIKIAAISGFIIAGIAITIFMYGGGPCDLTRTPEPPIFTSPKGKGIEKGPLDWVRDIKCSFPKPPGSSKETDSSPSASLSPSVNSKGSEQSSSLSAIFKFNSRDESRATGLNLEAFVYKDYPVKKFNPYLPIKIDFETDGKVVWKGEVTAGNCHDGEKVPYCEVKGYVTDPNWWKGTVKLRAHDVNGKRVASFDYEIAGEKK